MQAQPLKPLTEEEICTIQTAVHCIGFADIANRTVEAVIANSQFQGPPSSDKYQLHRHFLDSNDFVIFHLGGMSKVYQLGKLKIHRPPHLIDGLTGSSFGLVEQFEKMRTLHPTDQTRRLFQAVQWFFLSHTNAPEVSELSKLVMKATSLESLLSRGNSGKLEMAIRLDRKLSTSGMEIKSVDIPAGRHSPARTINMSKLAHWFFEFYDLRSRIVHGLTLPHGLGAIESKVSWVDHSIAADIAIWSLVTHRLLELNQLILRTLSEEEKQVLKVRNAEFQKQFERVFSALGWLQAQNAAPSS
jgi:hypothetical protein